MIGRKYWRLSIFYFLIQVVERQNKVHPSRFSERGRKKNVAAPIPAFAQYPSHEEREKKWYLNYDLQKILTLLNFLFLGSDCWKTE